METAMRILSIPVTRSKSFWNPAPLSVAIPAAPAVNFTSINNKGITAGKPITAISVALFFAFVAIAEIKVNPADKPKLPITNAKKNNPGLLHLCGAKEDKVK